MNREDKLVDLLSHLRYVEEEGKFYWSKPLRNRTEGALAGKISPEGYRVILWRGTVFSYKHIVWYIHTGKLIKQHEGVLLTKGDKLDTRFSQLHLHLFEDRWSDERIINTFEYNPHTGEVTLKLPVHGPVSSVGSVVGSKSKDGYMNMKIGSRNYRQHRVIWLIKTGEWPKFSIDHINGIRDDNRWENLRDVTNAVNAQNTRKAYGETGYLGVSKAVCGGYRARLAVGGKVKHLGIHKTPEEAHQAYLEAKRKYHEGNTL